MTVGDRLFFVEMATVYKILSPCMKECYVGSTIHKVEYRWTKHRGKANDTNSKILFENYGIENCKFVILEVCPLEEQHEKEQWWMNHSVGIVNKNGAILDMEKRKEHNREWSKTHRESRNVSNKKWRDANKEKKESIKQNLE